MIKIALTGNIASGKSETEKIIERMNFPIMDTDKIVHKLLENNNEIKEKIKTTFKSYDICDKNMSVSRKKLGDIVFSNNNLKKSLENIIHPVVIEEIIKFFDKNKNFKIVFVSVPLLYEADLVHLFDKVILIYADENVRKQRLINTRNFSEKEAVTRMKCQISQDEKAKLANYVIYNNSDIKTLQNQIKSVIEDFK